MILHRSHLFVPGSRPDMLEKAGRFGADVLCLDMEESVLPQDKARAREYVRKAVGWLSQAGKTVHVRVNSIQSGETRDDLAAAVQESLAGVLLAKTQSPQDIRTIDVLLREQELAHDLRPGSVELIAAIESAQAILRCEEISRTSTRLVALMLGGEDLSFDLGVERTKRGRELDYARGVIATCARAAGLLALDTPWPDIQDDDGLIAEAQRAREVGFSGKYVIHPSHIEPVHRVFTPNEEQVAYARKVLAAWSEAEREGQGAFQLDGRMIDRPVVERAQRLIEQAEAIANRAS